jgi:hypothetical protein
MANRQDVANSPDSPEIGRRQLAVKKEKQI